MRQDTQLAAQCSGQDHLPLLSKPLSNLQAEPENPILPAHTPSAKPWPQQLNLYSARWTLARAGPSIPPPVPPFKLLHHGSLILCKESWARSCIQPSGWDPGRAPSQQSPSLTPAAASPVPETRPVGQGHKPHVCPAGTDGSGRNPLSSGQPLGAPAPAPVLPPCPGMSPRLPRLASQHHG